MPADPAKSRRGEVTGMGQGNVAATPFVARRGEVFPAVTGKTVVPTDKRGLALPRGPAVRVG